MMLLLWKHIHKAYKLYACPLYIDMEVQNHLTLNSSQTGHGTLPEDSNLGLDKLSSDVLTIINTKII